MLLVQVYIGPLEQLKCDFVPIVDNQNRQFAQQGILAEESGESAGNAQEGGSARRCGSGSSWSRFS
jgi:hypothetical protein